MTKTLRAISRHWQIYAFLLLPTAYLIVFCYVPMAGVQLAFKAYHPLKGISGSPWTGFAQFEKFFSSYYFQRLIVNTLRISLYALIAGFPIPIAFALLLNAVPSKRLQKLVQTVTYMPHFISTVVLVGMLLQLFSPIVGLYANLCRLLGTQNPADLFSQPGIFPHLYVWSGVWQSLSTSPR